MFPENDVVLIVPGLSPDKSSCLVADTHVVVASHYIRCL